jgi:hypothetical protein
MPDTLTTITTLINSPPGVVVAGGVLAGIVWKFFERVEALLTDKTKFEMAVWLVGVKTADRVPWPETFATTFDRVFGARHLSGKCFLRSCIATLFFCVICVGVGFLKWQGRMVSSAWEIPSLSMTVAGFLFLFDYISLLESRYILRLMARWKGAMPTVGLLLADLLATGITGAAPMVYVASKEFAALSGLPSIYKQFSLLSADRRKAQLSIDELRSILKREESNQPLAKAKDKRSHDYIIEQGNDTMRTLIEQEKRFNNLEKDIDGLRRSILFRLQPVATALWLPTFFTSIWLWLYAGSGFLLKAARRFDIGFQWFNSKFDIEKKPLQAIGLVSGAIVAVAYWSFALVAHFI